MKMTIRQYANTRCLHILESDEYLLNAQRVSRFKGNGIDEEGEPIFGDAEGNSIKLSDIVYMEKEELYKAYPNINKDIIDKLYDAFYADYKFLSHDEIVKAMSIKAQNANVTTAILEELAGGWVF